MAVHPRLETPRLRLRPFVAEDAASVAELAGAREVAESSLWLPHPFTAGVARCEIAAYAAGFRSGRSIHFAIEPKSGPGLVGSVELREIDVDHAQAELACWIGRDAWGQGYAGEAVQAILRFGFEELALNRIHARHLLRSAASAAVLGKSGMQREGLLRQCVKRGERFEDVAICAALRAEWLLSAESPAPRTSGSRPAPGRRPEATP